MKAIFSMALALLLAMSPPALSQDAMAHAAAAGGEPGHAHALMNVEAATAPRITDLLLVEDAMSGVNLYLFTENFVFAPEQVNQSHSPGRGHAHIYVDGVKLGRLYGHAYHLAGLAQGQHRIEVTLNANDHSEYAVNGEKIAVSRTIIVR